MTTTRRRAVAAIVAGALASRDAVAQATNGGNALSGITSWAYQLQGDMGPLARSLDDVLVVDIDNVAWQTSANVLRIRPDGRQRLVVSYLSVGEAEDSRPYFARCCIAEPPSWLAQASPGWPGNFAVRFWNPAWQALVLARIDDLISAGYDGMYLDRLDVWEVMAGERASTRADMIAFIGKIAAYARQRAPGFIVIVQNAEELLDDPGHLATIDAIAKEDLFYGIKHDGQRNPADTINYAVRDLQRARKARKPVFVVEYQPLSGTETEVKTEILRQGFIPLIAGRNLDGN